MDENNINQMPPAGSGKKIAPAILGIIVLLAVAGYLLAQRGSETEPSPSPSPSISESATPIASATPTENAGATNTPTASPQAGIKVFTVNESSFSFSPAEIRVRRGDAVKIILIGKDSLHDFVIDALDVKTKRIAAGETTEVQFTANKTGTFEFYCSVGDHRARGMRGNLIVE